MADDHFGVVGVGNDEINGKSQRDAGNFCFIEQGDFVFSRLLVHPNEIYMADVVTLCAFLGEKETSQPRLSRRRHDLFEK